MELVSVLVVDDSPQFARAFAAALRSQAARASLSVQVQTVGSVAEALATAGGFDAAMLDVRLPDGTALDVLKAWRRSRRLRALRVRVISADPIDAMAAECLLLGAPTISKVPPGPLMEVALKLVREVAAAPRTSSDELRRFGGKLADEAKLPPGLRDVLVQRTLGASMNEVATSRGTSVGTVTRQSKQIAAALREIGVEVGDDLEKAVLRELISDRYDDE